MHAFALQRIDATQAVRFFGAQSYKANAKAGDDIFALMDNNLANTLCQTKIAGAVRLSPRECSTLGGEIKFLRNLCVARDRRRQGLGRRIAREAIAVTDCPIFCFCAPELRPLYQSTGFIESDDHAVPPWLLQQYRLVASQQARKARAPRLHIMTLRFPLSIVILQHANEEKRTTGTGALLRHSSLKRHAHVEVWRWQGRKDNERLQRLLMDLVAPTLLWATGAEGRAVSSPSPAVSTHVVLDGTWQEAQKIYRKGPALLRCMPRVQLASPAPSKFVLRGDYGWKERFGGASGEDDSLCCTAEVGAMLLERVARDATGGKQVRRLLDLHQQEYVEGHPHLHGLV